MSDRLARMQRVCVAGAALALSCAACVGCSSTGDGSDAPSGGAQAGAGNPSAGAAGLGTGGMAAAGMSSGGASGASGNGSSGATVGGASGAGGMTTAGAAGMPGLACRAACTANSKCEAATHTCVCNPGFVSLGNTCSAAPVGDPSTHTQAEVCGKWQNGHVITETKPLTASGAECEAGTLKPGAITDTLVRINMFRWFEGLGPVSDDAQYDADAQACSNLEAWWDFTSKLSPHEPPNTSKCYTAIGGATAGQSNISWGSNGPAQSIDQYMEDNGNDTTLGHRRWILNPPLNPVGIGYWQTGGKYGNSSCLRVFSSKGTGPSPKWNAVPPAGFAPLQMAKYAQWSFEGSIAGTPDATATVLRVDDNQALAVTVVKLSQGYGQNTMSFKPMGWTAEAGKTYRVTIAGLTGGNVVYDVKPVTCN